MLSLTGWSRELSKQPLVGIIQPVISESMHIIPCSPFKKTRSNVLLKPINIALVFS